MANWLHTLDLTEAFKEVREEKISAKAFLRKVLASLKALKVEGDDVYDEVVDDITIVAEGDEDDEEFTLDDVDYYLTMIYDWGDIPAEGSRGWPGTKTCWVEH